MKNKKLTVTVGIPAYNEEKNIKLLIKKILSQKENGFILQKIIIVSDACTDNTESISKSFKNPKIFLIKNNKRLGQSVAQNQIIKSTNSDVLIILEADTLPEGSDRIANLLKPMIMDKDIVLVQGNEKPQVAKSFIGNVFSQQFTVYNEELIRQPKLRSWITSGRGGRALRKNLYKAFRWQREVPEDVYLHLFCKNKGLKNEFAIDAVCKYKSPETYSDIKKEVRKVASGIYAVYKYFPKALVEQMYNKPFNFRIKCALRFLRTNPFYFISYSFSILFIFKSRKSFTDILPVTQTTKQVYE